MRARRGYVCLKASDSCPTPRNTGARRGLLRKRIADLTHYRPMYEKPRFAQPEGII